MTTGEIGICPGGGTCRRNKSCIGQRSTRQERKSADCNAALSILTDTDSGEPQRSMSSNNVRRDRQDEHGSDVVLRLMLHTRADGFR